MLTKQQLLAPLAALRNDAVVVTTMGTVRPWGHYSSSDLDFASADSAMGHAADLALGIALAQPHRKVICLTATVPCDDARNPGHGRTVGRHKLHSVRHRERHLRDYGQPTGAWHRLRGFCSHGSRGRIPEDLFIRRRR